jgi:hypothetical protein
LLLELAGGYGTTLAGADISETCERSKDSVDFVLAGAAAFGATPRSTAAVAWTAARTCAEAWPQTRA